MKPISRIVLFCLPVLALLAQAAPTEVIDLKKQIVDLQARVGELDKRLRSVEKAQSFRMIPAREVPISAK